MRPIRELQEPKATDVTTVSASRLLFVSALGARQCRESVHSREWPEEVRLQVAARARCCAKGRHQGRQLYESCSCQLCCEGVFPSARQVGCHREGHQRLGYSAAPAVNHSTGYREVEHGWHSSDIESEFAKLKGWLRARYGRLPRTLSDEFTGDLYEYMYIVNYSPTWDMLVEALVGNF